MGAGACASKASIRIRPSASSPPDNQWYRSRASRRRPASASPGVVALHWIAATYPA
ncbi:hypothetical protein [Amycolatopsis thermoflava]|uniref:hypothetical protein n=1 Tax=Amycolatopsis thermoflava TaxID=84480 RepID=UPI001E6145C6|nr:hypothetical protein [Amycolatopsis thermoflava]